jgi:hypothetical protein
MLTRERMGWYTAFTLTLCQQLFLDLEAATAIAFHTRLYKNTAIFTVLHLVWSTERLSQSFQKICPSIRRADATGTANSLPMRSAFVPAVPLPSRCFTNTNPSTHTCTATAMLRTPDAPNALSADVTSPVWTPESWKTKQARQQVRLGFK